MGNKVKVLIAGEMRAIFHQVVEMDSDEFERFDNCLGHEQRSARKAAQREIEGLLNCSEIVDLEDFELEEFQIQDQPQ